MGQRRPRRRRANQSSRSFPALAAAVGVIVVGFGIGAVIAGFSHRPAAQQSEVPAPAHSIVSRVTPLPAPTAPAAGAPRSPRPSASPQSSSSPHPSPTPHASAKPPASPSPQSSQASSEPSPPPSLSPTKAPAVAATRTALPRANAVLPPTASAAPSVIFESDTPVTRNASALVRRYIAAVMRGDTPGAYAALGGAPGDKGLALSEEEFLDPKARILSLRARARGEASATVEVEIASSKGTYFTTFQVAPGNQGPVIESHDFIKP